jgi:integrase
MGNTESGFRGIPKVGHEPAQRPRGSNRLTDAECKGARPDTKVRKLSDGKGLYLAVMPIGSKLWRLKYRHRGKEGVYSIGAYPEVTLAEAREKRDEARQWLRDGKDPVAERRAGKAAIGAVQANTFAAVAEEWLAKQTYSPAHLAAQRKRLDDDLLPAIGALPVAEVTPAQVLEVLRGFERRGALEMGAKCRRMASQIFRYAAQTARATSDPAALLVGAIKTPDTKHRATVPLKEMPALLKTIAAVPAELNTRLAFYWLLLTAARTGEMRYATWGEIEDGKLWRVPAERMKMQRPHVVPLSRQAQAVLKRAREIRTGPADDALLFPGFTRHGALSENALLALLARAGYFGRQTGHGFRASFSTWAHEVHEADPDVIEACLAHVKEGVRGVYNRASYLSKRAALLQAWADQCTAWGLRLP